MNWFSSSVLPDTLCSKLISFFNTQLVPKKKGEYLGQHWLSKETPVKYYADEIVRRYRGQHASRQIAHHA